MDTLLVLSSNRIAHCMTIISRLSLNLKTAGANLMFSNGPIFPRNLWSIQIPRPTHIQRIGRNLAAHVVKEPWELWVGWTVPYVQLRRMIGFFPK